MSITIATIQTDVNTYIGDASTNTVSAAQRLAAITEATTDLMQKLNNDHMIATYDFDFLDSINYYKITTAVPAFIDPTELRLWDEDEHNTFFVRKSPQDFAVLIGDNSAEESFSVERKDGNSFIGVIHNPKRLAQQIASCDSLTDNGSWAVDATNSDATNLTLDNNEFLSGSGSLNFDIDVSQSVNNRATLINSTHSAINMTDDEDLSYHLVEVYIPDVTNFTSVTLYWGDSSSTYWSATATTDIDGSAFVAGWSTVKIDWADATKTGAPDVTDTTYFRIDYNYGAGQGDDTDFRMDTWRIVRPEKLTLHYLSWNVGTNTGGTDITTFGATTDIPFFSGQYDHYRWYVSHKAAGILFRAMHQYEESQFEENEATKKLIEIERMFPTSLLPETKNFKVRGLNMTKSHGGGRRNTSIRRIIT